MNGINFIIFFHTLVISGNVFHVVANERDQLHHFLPHLGSLRHFQVPRIGGVGSSWPKTRTKKRRSRKFEGQLSDKILHQKQQLLWFQGHILARVGILVTARNFTLSDQEIEDL